MARVPRDSTVALLREGYPFISSRCESLGVDLFTSRLMLHPMTFMRGAEAARLFYDGQHFTRAGALPPSVQHLLQDAGSVHALDGTAHRHRKHAFLSLMGPEAMDRLGQIFEQQWHAAAHWWPHSDQIVLHEAVRQILTRTVCAWAGVPLPEDQAHQRSRELGMMIDHAAHVGPSNWYARTRRRNTERWAAAIVKGIRDGDLAAAEGTAAQLFATHRDLNGDLLSPDVAAVELINILRPTVAVARFIVFAALALHEHPQWRASFAAGDETDLEPFVQEVRRYYPFFPAAAGRVSAPFRWSGHDFAAGDRVMLDLYGTCHDPRLWEHPGSFLPERFRGWHWQEHPDTLIAQGAGRHEDDHRCPGEWSTVELLKRAVRLLATTDYQVPPQDLSIRLNHLPAIPRSRFVIVCR